MNRQNIFVCLFILSIIFLQVIVECKQNSDNDLILTLKQYLNKFRPENRQPEIQLQEQQNKIKNSVFILPSSQVESLTDLFYATNGHQWNSSANWLYGDPCVNAWYGVSCDPYNSTVLTLTLTQNNLVGTIPVSIYNLVGLNYLNLANNSISSTIPSNLFQLTSLHNIDLHNNLLSGSVPNFGSEVYGISLANNQLTGSIPYTIEYAYGLEQLNLEQNDISGNLPQDLPDSLEYFYVSGNSISGTIPSSYSYNTFAFLDLSYNEISGTIPYELFSSSSSSESMNTLNLSNNKLTGTIPDFGYYYYFQHLDLSRNNLTGTIPSSINSLNNLQYLDFSENDLSGSIPTNLYDVFYLRSLYLNNNDLTGVIKINKFYNLTYYDCSDNNFTCPVPFECGKFGNHQCLPCESSVISLLDNLSAALIYFYSNQNFKSLSILNDACENRLANEIFASMGLQNISCYWENSIKNGNSFYNDRENVNTKEDWNYLYDLTNNEINSVLVNYEKLIDQFQQGRYNFSESEVQTMVNEVINYSIQEANHWQTMINNITVLSNMEKNSVFYFREQLNYVIGNTQSEISTLLSDISQEFYSINAEIYSISETTFYEDMEDSGEALIALSLSLGGLSLENTFVNSCIELINEYNNTIQLASTIAYLEGAVRDLHDITKSLENAKNSFQSLYQLYLDISSNSPISSSQTPPLYINNIPYWVIDQSAAELSERILQLNNVEEMRENVIQLASFTKEFTQSFINYYFLELDVQMYGNLLEISSNSGNSLSYLLHKYPYGEDLEIPYYAAYTTAFFFQTGSSFRVLSTMFYLQRQYNFYSYSDYSFEETLPFNPNATSLSTSLELLYTSINNYLNSIKTSNTFTANYTLTAERNNNTFSQLQKTGKAFFYISLPDIEEWIEKGFGYYSYVEMIGMRAYPSPIVNSKFSTINVGLSHLGDNLFIDNHAKNWNFTAPVYNYTFIFDTKSLCSISDEYDPLHIDNVHYSPFGVWEIVIPKNQMDIPSITKIELQFTLYLTSNTNSHIPLWGYYPYTDIIILPPSC